MLVNRNSTSLWRTMLDEQKSSSSSTIAISHPSDFLYETTDNNDDDDDDEGDYADVLSPEYEIDRRQIQMIESLGNGQYGEVYRGILKVKQLNSPKKHFHSLQTDQQLQINIAIKTCKMQDTATTETFLDEACMIINLFCLILFWLFLQMSCKNSIIHILLNYSVFAPNNPFY